MKLIDKIKKEIQKSIDIINVKKEIIVEKSKGNGDYSSNIALSLAKELKKNPMEIAEDIVKNIDSDLFSKVEVAAPGFINFYINTDSLQYIIKEIQEQKNNFGKGTKGKYINVEYVSANPTGHLHVGHARGAVYGNVLIDLLRFAGNKVDSEYWINDSGNQINILGMAVFTRYKQQLGMDIPMPEDTYKGQEIIDVAKTFVDEFGDKYANEKFEGEIAELFKRKSKLALLEVIKEHLAELGVVIDTWTSEEGLVKSGAVDKAIDQLKQKGAMYEKENALWIKTEEKGDDKDRVVIKSDNGFTYLATDIANHELNKMSKPYDKLINVWGADHVGQVKRLQVALEWFNHKPDLLDIPMIQLVKLLKDGKELKMSKRAGTAYRLIDLVNEIGKDAARWYMVSRANDSQFTLDLNVIKTKSSDNTLFLVKYAHARANQLINKSVIKEEENMTFGDSEKDLLIYLQDFPQLIQNVASTYKVNLLVNYLIDLARKFNSWYSNNKIIGSENESSLIAITKATKQVIANGLNILGIEAPEKM